MATASPRGVRVYRAADGTRLAEIPDSTPPFALSPHGEVVAVSTRKGILLHDVDASRGLGVLEHSDGIFTDPRTRLMNVLAFSPDGNSVVAARNTLREGSIFALDVWSSATGRKVASPPATRDTFEHAGLVSGVVFAPGGPWLASGSHDHSIRLWDVGSRQCVERLYGNASEVWAVTFTADGRGVLSGAKDGTVRLWSTNTASRERLFEGPWTPIKFSRDGRLLAAVDDQSRLVLVNLKTGEPEGSLPLSKAPFGSWAGAVSDDFRVLVDPLPEGGFRVWDLPSRKSVDLKGLPAPNPDRTPTSVDSRKPAMHIPWTAVSPDGSVLLTGGGKNSALGWNLQEPAEAPLPLEGNGALFARNGRVLATLHNQSIKVWIAKPRSLRVEVPIEADLSFLTPLALSDEGDLLAVGSNPLTESENAIRLWDARNGKFLGVCKGHTQGVRWLAFSPDAGMLASVSDDSTLRFWDVGTQQELLSIRRLADPIREIVFSPDGDWLAAKSSGGFRLLGVPREPHGPARDSGGR